MLSCPGAELKFQVYKKINLNETRSTFNIFFANLAWKVKYPTLGAFGYFACNRALASAAALRDSLRISTGPIVSRIIIIS